MTAVLSFSKIGQISIGVSFVKELSFIDDGLWGFEITDADGYVLAFFQVRNK